jgi:hypothetical protein
MNTLPRIGLVRLIILLLALAMTSPLTAQQEDKGKPDPAKDGAKPRLVVQGKGYLIHALPRSTPVMRGEVPAMFRDGPNRFVIPDPDNSGLSLLYTTPADGQMRVLLTTGHYVLVGPPMGIDRVFHGQGKIAGTAVDASRLYVVWSHRSAVVLVQAAVPPPPKYGAATYRLLDFNLSDGKKVQDLELKGKALPESPPEETADRGPLQVRDGGVSCYGINFTVKGGRLALKEKTDEEAK